MTACTGQTVYSYLHGCSQVDSCFIKCSTMYPNIEIHNDHMLCISHIWTIVDCHSGNKFRIPITDNFRGEQCTRTYEVHLLPYIRYPNIIVFERDSLFMLDHFQA